MRAGAKDLENYEKLMEQTRQRLKILEGNLTSLIYQLL